MRKLPFLNGAKAFEAAARMGSFAKAADELHVTPAAISRLVQLLEARIGVSLFERRANRLVPTPAGRAYQAGLTPLFDALANLTAQVSAMAGARVLTVGVGPTFAIRWLIPRLAEFQRAAPDIEVRFATGGAAAPFSDDWTCGITLGDGEWPGFASERLFAADLTPVCAPAIARKLKRPEDLRAATLLRVRHAREDWPRWIKAAGLSKMPVKGPEFEFYGYALQAALDGVGVAMGISPYIDDDLRAGRLVAPFQVSVSKGKHWYLIYRDARRGEPGFTAFRAWLIETAGSKTL
ncbi:LysR family transcriptional regulator [Afipia sp. P52-10]|jgi:LysR family glycine cleavage system transcriptional activator|uniref:LysR substrate-binding domain-containing protein n=1 Tax=Afipia sp. P52-10 TaxID=1429916 RepID=UPI0003DF4144|nr:LysR substrate-binding domain-containing protein [Afipia sp. P52-10]ETR76061.1 LysR family transcriptional regulator [Afipia sp. P52-10]